MQGQFDIIVIGSGLGGLECGAMLAREGVELTPDVKEHLWSALTSLRTALPSERTLTGLTVLLQSRQLKQARRQ